ncbi:hypothetical protein NKG94_37860 [Micromonospora sp. M12]
MAALLTPPATRSPACPGGAAAGPARRVPGSRDPPPGRSPHRRPGGQRNHALFASAVALGQLVAGARSLTLT